MPLGSLERMVPDITNVQDKMSIQDIQNALKNPAAGELSLQQLPYDCPDSSFEFLTDSDRLKPAVVIPYEPPSKPLPERQSNRQAGRPIPVPNLDDIQPFMSEPDFVERPMSDIEALLETEYIKNPYPFPGDTTLLPSYSSEPAGSANITKLRHLVRHALAHSWKYDPVKCSVKAARDLSTTPNHGLTMEEYTWITGDRVRTVKKARVITPADFKKARKRHEWLKSSKEDDEIVNCDCTDMDLELDKFYGADGTDLRPVRNELDDEGFYEPNTVKTTVISVPDKSLMEEGVTAGGIFQDSGISMDDEYAQYSRAHALSNTANTVTGLGPSDLPTFQADVVPLQTVKKNGPRLRLIGDQLEREWAGRRQGPYDLHGLRPLVDTSRRASASRGVEVNTGQAGVSVASQMVDGPGVGHSHQSSPPPANEERLQHFSGPSIPATTPTTPMNSHIRQIQQVQAETPKTPATVNINLTPEHNSDMDADNTSNGSLEVRLTDSPTANTQKGQSALGHYVQETSSHPDLARQGSSTISLDGSESEEVSLIPTPDRPSQPEGRFSKGVELHQKKSDAVFTLSPSKALQKTTPSGKTAHVPATPANGQNSASFRPTTPFQLDTPTHLDLGSPGTPTPAPKTKKTSVMNVFKSSQLGIRSPEHARPSPEIIAPTTPTAGARPQHRGSAFGSQGLLFQKSKKNERTTKNVLNSLQLSPEQGNGSATGTSVHDGQDGSEDELAAAPNAKAYKGGKRVHETPSMMGRGGGREVAEAVVVPSEGTQLGDSRNEEPQKKKLRRSMRSSGGADVPDVGPFSKP